ncbi:MAG: branched-chain amino acid ABC transporter permease [Deltaproteobacteria bacterium]|nr:branched-chain amino acid ABC transporter permease [Deltaproteobacteria bacterium]
MATLGFGLATQQILGKLEFTGGHMGLHIEPARIGPWTLDSDFSRYWLIVPLTVLCVVGAYNLARSRVGRAFVAIRDSDVAAQATGVNLTYTKTLAFAVSTFFYRHRRRPVRARRRLHLAGEFRPLSFDQISRLHRRRRPGLDTPDRCSAPCFSRSSSRRCLPIRCSPRRFSARS